MQSRPQSGRLLITCLTVACCVLTCKTTIRPQVMFFFSQLLLLLMLTHPITMAMISILSRFGAYSKRVICDGAETMPSSCLMSSSGFMSPLTADGVPVRCSCDCADQQQLNKSQHWTADRGYICITASSFTLVSFCVSLM